MASPLLRFLCAVALCSLLAAPAVSLPNSPSQDAALPASLVKKHANSTRPGNATTREETAEQPQPQQDQEERPFAVTVNRTRHHNDTAYPVPAPSVGPRRGVPVDFSLCPFMCNGHGADCVPSTSGGVAECVCKAGFDGGYCQNWVGCAENNFCNGHGSCSCTSSACSCRCKAGWMGSDCGTPIGSQCKNHCSGRGTCRTPDFKCDCETGFTGEDCSRVAVPSVCQNACSGQGSCNMLTETCSCAATVSGTDCSKALDMCGGCRHGKCLTSSHGSSCQCDSGFTGPHCDVFSPQESSCLSRSHCSGRGVCMTNGSCTCQDGFIGDACGLISPVSPTVGCINFCSGHGRCDALLDECVCDGGFTGASCAESLCPLSNSTICGGRGLCAQDSSGAFSCQCDPCFSGSDCSENALEQCPNICNEHGSCVCTNAGNHTKAVCECDAGWEGDGCQFQADANEACCPLQCSGNGECHNCTCECFDDWTGQDCAVSNSASTVPPEDALDDVSQLLQVGEGSDAQWRRLVEESKALFGKDDDAIKPARVSMSRLWD